MATTFVAHGSRTAHGRAATRRHCAIRISWPHKNLIAWISGSDGNLSAIPIGLGRRSSVRLMQVNGSSASSDAQVDHLYKHCEAYSKVDVPLRYVHAEAVGDQRNPYQK
jgi:hypothetical protein